MKPKPGIRKKTRKKRVGYGKPLLKRRRVRKLKARKRGLVRRKRTPRQARKRRILRHKRHVRPRDFTVPVKAPHSPAPAPEVDPQAVGPGTVLPNDGTAFNKGYEDAYEEGFNQGFSKGYEEGNSLANQA
ncbi:FliH/SctL family protein [Paenibacillus jiagnxiensis]|uniref:hypothetical protein n=1 Tax=Paenibacillus jiagnxiensis TaxID=3228926 RepID=UPI0033A7E5D7